MPSKINRAALALFVVTLVSVAAPALAQEADTGVAVSTDSERADLGSFLAAAEIGAAVPFTSLGPHIAFGLELGYVLPFAGRRIDVFFAGGFTPPGNTFVTTERYEGDVTQQELYFSLGPRFRLFELGEQFNLNLGLGPRLYLLQSWSNGSRDGNPFAEFSEQSTQIGFFVVAGGELVLGPGALLLDIDFGYSNLPHTITGDVSTAGLAFTLGYRFYL